MEAISIYLSRLLEDSHLSYLRYRHLTLLEAVEDGDVEAVRALLRRNTRESVHWALVHAVIIGKLEIVKVFVEKGVLNYSGWPFRRAVEFEQYRVISYLLDKVPSIVIYLSYLEARERGQTFMVRMLKKVISSWLKQDVLPPRRALLKTK